MGRSHSLNVHMIRVKIRHMVVLVLLFSMHPALGVQRPSHLVHGAKGPGLTKHTPELSSQASLDDGADDRLNQHRHPSLIRRQAQPAPAAVGPTGTPLSFLPSSLGQPATAAMGPAGEATVTGNLGTRPLLLKARDAPLPAAGAGAASQREALPGAYGPRRNLFYVIDGHEMHSLARKESETLYSRHQDVELNFEVGTSGSMEKLRASQGKAESHILPTSSMLDVSANLFDSQSPTTGMPVGTTPAVEVVPKPAEPVKSAGPAAAAPAAHRVSFFTMMIFLAAVSMIALAFVWWFFIRSRKDELIDEMPDATKAAPASRSTGGWTGKRNLNRQSSRRASALVAEGALSPTQARDLLSPPSMRPARDRNSSLGLGLTGSDPPKAKPAVARPARSSRRISLPENDASGHLFPGKAPTDAEAPMSHSRSVGGNPEPGPELAAAGSVSSHGGDVAAGTAADQSPKSSASRFKSRRSVSFQTLQSNSSEK